MSVPFAVRTLIELLTRQYGDVTPFGRSRLYRCGEDMVCSINYSKLLRGHKYFFGLSQEVVLSNTFPETTHGPFVLLVCGAAETVLVLPRPLVLQMLEGVSTRRLDVFLEDGRYILQTTGHPKLDVTGYLNAYPLRTDERMDDSETESVSTEVARPVRDHVDIQWALIRLGRAAGHSVWVPPGDRHLAVGNHSFESYTLDRFPRIGFDEITRRIVQNIDVLWLDRGVIRKAFEIEATTTIYSGLLRLNDLMLSQPNNNIDMYVSSSSERRDHVARQLMRPSFQSIIGRCQFLDFQNVRTQIEKLDSLSGGKELRVSGLIQGETFDMPDHLLYPPDTY